MAKIPLRVDNSNIKNLLASIDNFLFDCDGVLYRGGNVVEGTPQVIHKLLSLGKNIFYVTNNSSKSRQAGAKKLTSMGFPASPANIISSAYVTACYVSGVKKGGKVFVLGDEGVQEELREKGLTVVLPQEKFKGTTTTEKLLEYQKDPEVSCVVVGLLDELTYLKASQAMSYLYHTDLLFVSTNRDSTYPGSDGKTFPGGGSVVAMVATAAERQPDVDCGKPGHVMADVIKKSHGVDFGRSLMVGDRLDTDIQFGISNGMKTMLVLTGASTQYTLDAFSKSAKPSKNPTPVPDFYLPSLADLINLI